MSNAGSFTRKKLLRESTKKLQSICKKNNVKTTGTRSELITRILKKEQRKATKKKLKKIKSGPQFIPFLVSGYIHQYYSLKAHHIFPSSILPTIVQYSLSIRMHFDLCHENYKNCLFENGTIFKRGNDKLQNKQYINQHISYIGMPNPPTSPAEIVQYTKPIGFYVGCSKGFKSGIQEFCIKVMSTNNKLGSYDFVGIIKNDGIHNICQMEFCETFTVNRYIGYYWTQLGEIMKYTGADSDPHVGFKDPFLNELQSLQEKRRWQENYIIKIRLDCKSWKVIFRQNGELIWSKSIERGKYHLLLYSENHNTQYQITSYNF